MKTKKEITQKEQVLKHLLKFKTLSPLQAWTQYGIYRVASYVCTLKREGFKINNIQKEKKKNYAVYTLVK